MEFITILGLALVGGALLAVLIGTLHIHPRDMSSADAVGRGPLSPADINMSSIQVAGIGGLGMVAVCVVVALTMPAVGIPVGAGIVAGGVMALVLIRRRRSRGVLPSSTQRPGANTILAIDSPDEPAAPRADSERNAPPRRVPEIAFQI